MQGENIEADTQRAESSEVAGRGRGRVKRKRNGVQALSQFLFSPCLSSEQSLGVYETLRHNGLVFSL